MLEGTVVLAGLDVTDARDRVAAGPPLEAVDGGNAAAPCDWR